MNKLIIVCAAIAVVGCATTEKTNVATVEPVEMEVKVKQYENIDKSLKASESVTVKELEPTEQEAKINALIKECLGVGFGEENTKYTERVPKSGLGFQRARVIPVIKKIGYFDKAYGSFADGKLYAVSFYMEVDKKYSYDSVKLQFDKTVSDIATTIGVDPSKLNGKMCHVGNITIDKSNGIRDTRQSWRMDLTFRNGAMLKELRKEEKARKNAQGETLPPPK